MYPDLEQAVALVEQLQAWIEEHWKGDPGVQPYANLTWTPYTLSIAVDDWTLYCDQADCSDDLSLDFLIREYLLHLKDQVDSFKDCPIPSLPEPESYDEDGYRDLEPSDN